MLIKLKSLIKTLISFYNWAYKKVYKLKAIYKRFYKAPNGARPLLVGDGTR